MNRGQIYTPPRQQTHSWLLVQKLLRLFLRMPCLCCMLNVLLSANGTAWMNELHMYVYGWDAALCSLQTLRECCTLPFSYLPPPSEPLITQVPGPLLAQSTGCAIRQ